jgi:5-methylcytosine-specific restriction endonuclease McrA
LDDAQQVRKPPVRAVLALHKQGVRGLCGWCGLAEMAIIEQPSRARDAVFARDRGVCADCSEDWALACRYEPESRNRDGSPHIASLWFQKGSIHGSSFPFRRDDEGPYLYVALRAVSLWHVDHKVPLFRVRHMPPLQRIEYFKLANLITRCAPCHERKSAKESAERAHFRALTTKAEKPKRRWPKRKLQSRGFQKRIR